MKKYTFTKEERLCSKSVSDLLFHEGSSFMLYPYRVVFLAMPVSSEIPSEPSPQILISVPKKRFKKAVTRNLIKRRIRECYRLQKEEFLYQPFSSVESQSENLYFAVQYIGKVIEPYSFMSVRMESMLKRLTKEIQKLKS